MDLEGLRSECKRLWNVEDFKNLPILIDIYKNCLFQMIMGHSKVTEDNIQRVEAKLIAQMMFTKLAHLEQVCSGIEFKARDGSVNLNKIIDATIVGSMVRGIFEMVGVFNMVFVDPKSDEERLILYNLWVISGLNYRQRFNSKITLPESLAKSRQEKIKIDKYTKAIEQTNLFNKLKEKDQQKLIGLIDQKKFSVYFDGKGLKVINGFQEIIARAGLRDKIMGDMYNYFSLNTHPSNVSVFQFGQMFDVEDPSFIEITTFHMKNAFILLSVFIADYIKIYPEVLPIFGKLDLRDQIVIDFLNVFGRTDQYMINQCLFELR